MRSPGNKSLRPLLRSFVAAAFVAATSSVTAPDPDLPGERSGASSQAGEYEVKAAFLYNFALYVRWPDEAFDGPRAPVVFAVLGEDPFGEVLDDTLADRKVHDRSVVVRRFRRARDIEPCHVLFVPRSEVEQLVRVLEAIGRRPVLLVGEDEDFAVRGGVVNFFIDKKRVRFEINPDAARRRDLRVSSKLLSLARIVSAAGAR